MARLYLLDVIKQEAKVVNCKSLKDYYKYLGCDCFDIAVRRIEGTAFDIFVDDEGLLKDNPIVSAVDSNGAPMLVGNLIFVHHDSAGNTTSISNEDITLINTHITNAIAFKGDEPVRVQKVLVGLEY